MTKRMLTIVGTVWVLFLMGCGIDGAHEITSEPPGATIYSYQASGRKPWLPGFPHWYKTNKPTPEQMRYAHRSSRPILTPHTFTGGPFSHWYQVRKEGYVDSEIVFLESRESTGTLSHHFVLEKLPN